MQRFRGGVYLHDGAVLAHELTKDGRHCQPIDDRSWHVLTLDAGGSICACLRFYEQDGDARFDHMWLRHSAMADSPTWGGMLRHIVELEILRAEFEHLRFGEVGGWAIAPERRMTMEPLRTILATYGLLELLGGCLGVATATRRHSSAPILRKIGLAPLNLNGQEMPAYYDPRYRCDMEVLAFDSRHPNPKFRNWIEELSEHLSAAPVFCDRPRQTARDASPVPLLVPTPALSPSF
jgi:hypothetical protein